MATKKAPTPPKDMVLAEYQTGGEKHQVSADGKGGTKHKPVKARSTVSKAATTKSTVAVKKTAASTPKKASKTPTKAAAPKKVVSPTPSAKKPVKILKTDNSVNEFFQAARSVLHG